MEGFPETKNNSVLKCMVQPFWHEMSTAKNVLISGCGGGYDFFSGIPLFFALRKAGVNVFLGNLTFTSGLESVSGKKYGKTCVAVTSDSKRPGKWNPDQNEYYFPEFFVSRWFKEKENVEVPVFTFEATGVMQMREAYQAVVDAHEIDTVILVDGGTDSLMTGDECGLGTPTEDMTSIAAVNGLKNLKKSFLVCLGFGVDTFHGVCHSHFLENVANLSKSGGFLGSFSLLSEMEEAKKFKEIYELSQPENSIVCSSILSAVEGKFGNTHSTHTKDRTAGSELYISPIMSMFWAFRLSAVANSVLYLQDLEGTRSKYEVRTVIHTFCEGKYFKAGVYTGQRPKRTIPY